MQFAENVDVMRHGKSARIDRRSILLPQNEQFYVTDSLWVNLDNVMPACSCSFGQRIKIVY